MHTNTAALALTDTDLTAAFDAVEALGADDDFTAWCDERRDAWADAVEAEGDR